MKYKVTITETLTKEVEVEANSLSEAEALIEEQWEASEIILYPEDFLEVDFDAKEIKETLNRDEFDDKEMNEPEFDY